MSTDTSTYSLPEDHLVAILNYADVALELQAYKDVSDWLIETGEISAAERFTPKFTYPAVERLAQAQKALDDLGIPGPDALSWA